ncbi:hypothetical protein BJ944DRAFT_268997 [Cunninghamella echinulata]|nr:hypothetical protein BJ944DRAFT_268997 [Cunninghamella echinulata]
MNILPHKSWHVYNKKNIEKVRKDEEKAKQEQDAKDKRSTLADSEARIQLLRERAEKRYSTGDDQTSIEPVRLFADIEKAAQNDEVLAEKKQKELDKERQFTMYLDKGTSDKEIPWYAKKQPNKYTDEHISKPYIKSKHDKDIQIRHKRPAISIEDDPLVTIKTHLEKHETKHQKKHKSTHHHHSKKKSSLKKKSSSSIEQLRAQRLEREKAERLRTQSVIYGDNSTSSIIKEDRHQPYHSQYNKIETNQAQQSKRRR